MSVRHYMFRLVLASISIMTISFSVLAQSVIGQDDDPLGLLMFKSIQDELNLTSDQRYRLEQIYTHFQTTMCELTSSLKHGVIPSQSQRDEIDKRTKKVREEVMEVLRAYQSVRFRELLLQTFGWGALLDPEMIKAFDIILGLTWLQKWKLNRLSKQVRQQMVDSERGAKKKDFMEETNEKVWNVLSTEQQRILTRMTGKKFTFSEPSPQLKPCS